MLRIPMSRGAWWLMVMLLTPAALAQDDIDALRREVRELRAEQEALRQAHEDLLMEMQETGTPADELEQQRRFSVYGFFDANAVQWWHPDTGIIKLVGDPQHSFVFGSLNMYFDFQPLTDWRFLTEVRFLLNPLGDLASIESDILGTAYRQVNTTTIDPVGLREEIKYGSLEIERARVEWTRLEWMNVTVGLFLTPFGIWNVDHGSPTRVTVSEPPVYSSYLGAFPERQLGVKLHGSFLVGDLNLAYDVTLSNGRGLADTLRDSNWDKAVGARLEASSDGRFSWKLGASFYTGEVTESKQMLGFLPNVDVTREIESQFREWAIAADLSIHAGPFLFQLEILNAYRVYDDDHRPPKNILGSFTSTGGLIIDDLGSLLEPAGFEPDKMSWGVYGLVAYRLPIEDLQLRPYLLIGWVDFDDNLPDENAFTVQAGINWRIGGAVVVKAEYMMHRFPTDSSQEILVFGPATLSQLALQIAVAF